MVSDAVEHKDIGSSRHKPTLRADLRNKSLHAHRLAVYLRLAVLSWPCMSFVRASSAAVLRCLTIDSLLIYIAYVSESTAIYRSPAHPRPTWPI